MVGTYKTEHVRLQVEDLDNAVEFYEEAFGLAVVSRDDECVYFGCGYDENYDLAVQKGCRGLNTSQCG